jgi:adenylate cyclase
MDNKGKKSFFKKWQDRLIVLLIVCVWTAAAVFGLLQKFDYRLYDQILGMRKEPASRPELLFVEIDNESLEALGAWPWSRDVIADALLRMKELGAGNVVFDIEYLSPSNLGVNPDAAKKLENTFAEQKQGISDVITELTAAVQQGSVSPREMGAVSRQMVNDYINPAIDSLYNSVQENVYRDNDTFFASSLQFFGNSWLTINIADIQTKVSDEDRAYVVKRCLFKNIDDPRDLIRKGNLYYQVDQKTDLGFSPALHDFMMRAKGAGFTNIVLDSDGTRRRVELLSRQGDGGYVGQLVFAPLLKLVDAQKIVRKGSRLVVEGALLPGAKERQTISIPLDSHGRMLINWLHKEFKDSFRHESVMFLNQLDQMEKNIVLYLENLNGFVLRSQDGTPLPYSDATASLLAEYSKVSEKRAQLLNKCKGYDENGNAIDGGIAESDYTDYFGMRSTFFEHVTGFVAGEYEQQITARLDAMKNELGADQYSQIGADVKEQFDGLKHENALYAKNFADMKKAYSGSFCIIGNSASSTSDLGTTPYKRAYPNVGTHANVYNTIMNKDFITPVSWVWGVLAAALAAFAAVQLTAGKKAWQQNVAGFASIIVIVGAGILLLVLFGVCIPIIAPAFIVITSYLVVTVFRFVTSEKDKGVLRRAFSTYLAPTVVEQIVKDPSKLTLGGEEKRLTALFTDIKSFSSFSELVTPTKLVSVLNDYLGVLSDNIMDEGGTIDKYIGDEIVSFFGAPLELKDGAYRACVSGIRMKQAEAIYNKQHLATGDIPCELTTRVGINTGLMVVGNMGTKSKMNYTIMGNDVNLASRLEGVNKMYHSWILASESTWNDADSGEHRGELISRCFDRVRVVGIEKPVQLYNILGFKNELSKEQLESVDIFHAGLEKYLRHDFAGAGKLFVEANARFPSDESPLVYAARCKEYIEKGIPDNWDGVLNMTTK